MRGGLAILIVALAAGTAAAGAGAGAMQKRALPTKASLRVTSNAPLTLRGRGFRAKEKVRVVVRISGAKTVSFARTTRAGAFTLQFVGTVPYDPCNADFVATAVGVRGDSAVLKLPQRACPPSP